ncbi:MAG: glutamine--fructose-6-phosphate transaminase (isomerizing) [Planctomycetes bacterium]|nr:glutamine--fructose-6-phosphate transaminase (isomerizing) [Planctomycetota bacterium]
MCGIFGSAARRDVAGLIVESLRHLEYRGYDSAGIAMLQGGELAVVRREGRIDHLAAAVQQLGLRGETGIGHTRWATHGAPSERNAHPHRDCAGDVAVIHNGIIENHEVLRARLAGLGHRFASETDSEILPHLIEEYLKEHDLLDAVCRAVGEICGTYAFVVLDRTRPGRLVGGRRDSPLVVGLGAGENFLSSDVAALLPVTRDVVFLENGEVVEIRPESVTIIDRAGRPRAPRAERIDWDAEAAAKGGYRHFMQKEIEEQPAVVARTLQRHLDAGGRRAALAGSEPLEQELGALERITIIACGTSWHAGLVAKFLIESRAGVPVEVDYASEFRYREPVLARRHLVIAISQSGETLDTLAAVRDARSRGARLLSIVNVKGSSLTRESDAVLLTDAGPEIGVASTKAFTTQLMVLELPALKLAASRGRLSLAEEQEAVNALRRAPLRMQECLAPAAEIAAAAEEYRAARDFLFLGRGVNYPIALEGALKLKEISYVHAEGYPAGEMKHGPIALIDKAMPVVVIATPGRVYEKVLSNMQEVKARGGRIIAVAAAEDAAVAKLADAVLPVPVVEDEISPLINVLPLQRLAYWIADLRGCDIDKPRNLAKSVTVE